MSICRCSKYQSLRQVFDEKRSEPEAFRIHHLLKRIFVLSSFIPPTLEVCNFQLLYKSMTFLLNL